MKEFILRNFNLISLCQGYFPLFRDVVFFEIHSCGRVYLLSHYFTRINLQRRTTSFSPFKEILNRWITIRNGYYDQFSINISRVKTNLQIPIWKQLPSDVNYANLEIFFILENKLSLPRLWQSGNGRYQFSFPQIFICGSDTVTIR